MVLRPLPHTSWCSDNGNERRTSAIYCPLRLGLLLLLLRYRTLPYLTLPKYDDYFTIGTTGRVCKYK